jgi:hypothetical protein
MVSRTPNQAWSKDLDAGSVHAVNCRSRNSNCERKFQFSGFLCTSGWLNVLIIPDKWNSAVLSFGANDLGLYHETPLYFKRKERLCEHFYWAQTTICKGG